MQVEAIKIQSLSNEYIKELPSRCLKDISEKNYDSVITKSRTLLEEVIEYKINEKNEQVQTLGDIVKMYNQFKELYNMKQNGKFDNRVNDLLNGLEKIINSVANLRNINSDAHGAGQRRVEIKEREARLIINSAMTVSEYILSVGR